MFIVPITRMPGVESLEAITKNQTVPVQNGGGQTFQDIFKDAIKSVEETQAASNHEDELLASGNIDDLHTAMIQAQQTAAAVEFTTQLTSKAVGAYNQIMGMQV